MTVSTFKVPDAQNQTVNAYNGTIAADFAVFVRLGAVFAPHAQEPSNMTIVVDAGHFVNANVLTEVPAQVSVALPAPTSQDRIDRIVANRSTGIITVVSGTENATPTAPAIPQNAVPIARVLLQPGMAAITNDRITDERDLAGLGRPSAEGGLLNIQNFKQNGTYTPTSGTTRIVVEVQGGGGSGGSTGATNSSQIATASGGAAGGYAKSVLAVPDSGIAVTVGAGGAASAAGANRGNAGGTTSFGSLIVANGGGGGAPGVPWPQPLVAGGAVGGAVVIGGNIIAAAGMTGGHGVGLSLSANMSGTGGSSPWGGGGVPNGNDPGGDARAPGAGGGGAGGLTSRVAQKGGAGADGIVIVHEYS